MAELAGEFHFPTDTESKAPEEHSSAQPAPDRELPPPHISEASAQHVPVQKPVHFYTSLSEYPENVSFDAQDPDEKIILLLRRSFVTNIPWIFFVFLLSLLPPLLLFLPLPGLFAGISPLTIAVEVIFYYLILFGVALVNFSLWYFHVGLVTNKRVIDVDLHGILSRHVAETRLNLLQDVSYRQVGFLRSLFHYGDVYMQTAGSHQNVEFDRVPRPMFVAQVIGDLIGREYHEAHS